MSSHPSGTHTLTPKKSPVAHRKFWEHRWRQRGAGGPGKGCDNCHILAGWRDVSDLSRHQSWPLRCFSESLVHGLVSAVTHILCTHCLQRPPLKTSQLTHQGQVRKRPVTAELGLHQTYALSASLRAFQTGTCVRIQYKIG